MANTKAKSAPVEEAAADIEVGSNVTFLGYDADTPEAERILEAGERYEVIELPGTTEIDGEVVETGYVLRLPNPDFNKKKKVHAETNPEFLETEVFAEEIELYVEGDDAGAEGGEAADAGADAPGDDDPLTYEELAGYDKAQLLEFAEVNEVKLTAADKKTDKALLAKLAAVYELSPAEPAPTKAPAKPAAKTAAAKPAAEAPAAKPETAAAKKKREAAEAAQKTAAAAKNKGVNKSPEGEVDPDEVPDLDNEDDAVLALIDGDVDLVEVAQELESAVAVSEYQLGGVLYHIKKEKVHLAVDKKGKLLNPEYGETGGFKLFLQENFNLDYRKATYLIDIYINFTQAGIENPSEVVGRIGWTKASKIAKPLGLPDADVEGLIQAAENNTVQDLSTIIKDEFTVGGGEGASKGSEGTKVNRLTLRFRFVEEEANVVEDILKEAAEKLGVKEDEALFQILTEYHAQALTGDADAQDVEDTAKAAANAKPATRGKPRGAARA